MRTLALLCVLGFAATTPALAQFQEIRGPEPPLMHSDRDGGSILDIEPGVARLVRFDKPVSTIIVGDPAVVRVTAQTDRLISLISVTSNGTTNLIALSENGEELFNGLVRVLGRTVRRVEIFAKPRLHEYWTYFCTPTSCHRTRDEFEGEIPAVALPRGNYKYDTTTREGAPGPGARPSVPRPPPE